MLLGCGIAGPGLQILSCVVDVAIYVFIGPSLTFSVGRVSFLGLPTLFDSIWGGFVVCCFISNIRTRTGLPLVTLIDSNISSLYRQDVPDPATANCKGCD